MCNKRVDIRHNVRIDVKVLLLVVAYYIIIIYTYNVGGRLAADDNGRHREMKMLRTCVCVCVMIARGACWARVERERERPRRRRRRRRCLAGAFTTHAAAWEVAALALTSPCDHREETGLIPGGRRRYIRV